MTSSRLVVRIGTRGSALARHQATLVADALGQARPTWRTRIVTIRTTGDTDGPAPAWRNDRPGIFTTDLTGALAAGAADLAVHSLKDLPVAPAAGIELAAILPREDPADVLISRGGVRLDALASGSSVGTSSLRRRAYVLRRRPDLRVIEARGNVPTRLDEVARGALDAIVVALAGVRRLALDQHVSEVFPPDRWLPAPGQGAIGVEAREDDRALLDALAAVDHQTSRLATAAERSLLFTLGGGCRAPVGALATPLSATRWSLAGQVCDLNGGRMLRAVEQACLHDESDAWALGRRLACALLDLGAGRLLAVARLEIGNVG